MKPTTLLIALFLTACNPSQEKPPDRTLNPDDAEPMICTDDTLEQRRAYVASCVGQDCFEESVALFCEEMK